MSPRLRTGTRSSRPTGPARDAGAVGGLEVLPFSVLIFVSGTLLLVNVWGVVDARLATAEAAREAARTYAESTDPVAGAAAADRAGRLAVEAYGRRPDRLELDGPDGSLARCGTVAYTARYPVPAIRLPIIGGFGRAFEVTARHTTRVDRLAAGLHEGEPC